MEIFISKGDKAHFEILIRKYLQAMLIFAIPIGPIAQLVRVADS